MSEIKESIIGAIPFDATVQPLGDCILTILDHRGKTPIKLGSDWVEDGIPAISAKNIHNGELDNLDSIRYVTTDIYKKWMNEDVLKGDCFLVSEGATLGEYLYWDYDFPIVLSQRLFCIRTNPKILYSKYFYAYMNSFNFQMQVKGMATGSSVDGLRQTAVRQLLVPIRPMNDQIFIGDLLYKLDKKKKDLQAQNKTLEEIAQTIFKEWFGKYQIGDELPEGWRAGKLSEIAEFLNGLALQKYPVISGQDSLPVIKIRELKQGITSNTDRANKELDSKYIVENGDVLFSWSGSLEVVIWQYGQGALNQHLFKVTSNDYPKWFYYYWTLEHLTEFRGIASDKATTMGHINRNHLDMAKVLIPDKNDFEKLNGLFNPILEKLETNYSQIQTLTLTRDELLPKLMSGEIRVTEFIK